AVRRADLSQLPEPQQLLAKRLIQRTQWLLAGLITGAVGCLLLAGLWITQLTSVHLKVQEHPPYSLVFYSGVRRLDFLPRALGARPLLDTGLTVSDLSSRQGLVTIENTTFSSRDFEGLEATRGLLDHLDPETAGMSRCFVGDWQAGLRTLCDL